MNNNDTQIIRGLASRVAELSALPVMKEHVGLWKKLNSLKPERPMVAIDQVCWHEMNVDDELTPQCEDSECRQYEQELRRILYRWKHFPADMVIEPLIRVPKAIGGISLGISAHDETAVTDPDNDVVGHKYINQIHSMKDVEKVIIPIITHDKTETARRMEVAGELFSGILDVVEGGYDPYLSVWDPIATWMGVENALYAMVDMPEVIHALVSKIVSAYMSMLNQMEEQGLLCRPQPNIHCTGAWTDELPADGYNPLKPRTKDIWMFGLAQMFSTVSPEMFEEFEIEPCQPLYQRFGLVYYGCCDPLDIKMEQVKKIKNVRKISSSPWVNEEKMAEQIGKQYVYSRKPNPAFLAWELFDEGAVRSHLMDTVKICRKYGCPLEIILKDISTVKKDPSRLWRWSEIAKEAAYS